MVISYSEIESKIRANIYDTKLHMPTRIPYRQGYVFDENQSVKWNREEAERREAQYHADLKEYRDDCNRLDREFMNDVISYIEDRTGKHEQAVQLFNYAYREGHDTGYGDVLTIADEILDIICA